MPSCYFRKRWQLVEAGIYNGLSTWGRIENAQGQEVETLYVEMYEDWDDPENPGIQVQPDFMENNFFQEGGYTVV